MMVFYQIVNVGIIRNSDIKVNQIVNTKILWKFNCPDTRIKIGKINKHIVTSLDSLEIEIKLILGPRRSIIWTL